MADRVGQQLGNYRLVRLLGRGGFAEVYLGEHTRLGTQAAIKVLHTQLASDEESVFQQEARTIAALEHPQIIRVLDFDVQEGTPFLVMQYAPNGTLRTIHPRGSQLDLATILPYVKQVAEALQYAHDEKLIHRDIKPENMLLGKRGEVLLSDFGIATVAQSSRYQGTQEVAGTVAYMAPEQVQGKPRPASDQYALGITVYEWLMGERPFHGSFTEIATQHVLTPPPPLREKLPTISPAVEQVVLIALAKDAKERFGSVQAFATALEQAALLDQPTQFIRLSAPLAPAAQAPTIVVPPERAPGSAALPPTVYSPQPTQPAQPLGVPLLTYHGHTGWIYDLAWSPDGQRIASASDDKTVRLWGTASGNPLLSYTRHTSEVWAVAWSPDGNRLASAGSSDGTVQVWDDTGSQKLSYHGHAGFVFAVSWSPDGAFLASGGGKIHIWNATTGSVLTTYGDELTFAVAWSPQGTFLASGGDGKAVQVYDVQTQTTLLHYRGHTGSIRALAWSPDGRFLASGGIDDIVQVWEATTGTSLLTYRGHTKDVRTLAWSPDGTRLASGSEDTTVQVWEAFTGKRVATSSNHSQSVLAVSWSPDGTRIASAGKDKTVQVWRAL